MNRLMILAAIVTTVGVGKFVTDPPVNLQASTPGTIQTGNANVSGTIRAGTFYGSSGGSTTKVVSGWATSPTGYVFGGDFRTASTDGRGVFGSATATTGNNYGGDFRSASTNGCGVFGYASNGNGTNYGGQFRSDSPDGTGVLGIAGGKNGNTYGGYFTSTSDAGRGLFAQATSGVGGTYGAQFQNASTTGIGVYCLEIADTGNTIGGYFESLSTSGTGVAGFGSASTGSTYGVRGVAYFSPDGFGVYSFGNSGTSGTKAFRIDHPSDPLHKYLLHYSTESPMPQNFYSGNIVTDGKGYAWVELPEYFQDINANFKYQLTVINGGQTFVQAMVSKEIVGNRFQVHTSSPSAKVSWRVEADRNDLWVRANKPRDTAEKQGAERGKYQQPELYGAPPEMGMNYRPKQDEPRQPK